MTTPRSALVHPEVPLFYHLVSHCIGDEFLCGRDRRTGRSYDHRRQWFIDRIMHLGRHFAIEVHAYAIMANHFHIAVFYDPTAATGWPDDEVADRWLAVCPSRLPDGSIDDARTASRRTVLLASPERLEHCRRQLGSLSTFMKFLKQPIARRANRESGTSGHFFSARFYSGVLLDEEAVVAACAYVDLNPVRARIAKTLEQCKDASISKRLRDAKVTAAALAAAVGPIVSGLAGRGRNLRLTLGEYIERLARLMQRDQHKDSPETQRWRLQVGAIKRRQRAFGSIERLQWWSAALGLRRAGHPLPS